MASSDDNVDETLKYKVGKVLEMHPNKNKQEVKLVLEYFSFDVDTVVNAYTEGNIPDVLKNSSNSVRTNNKNKRKKKKNKKSSLAGPPQLSDSNVVETTNSSSVKGDVDDDDEYELPPSVQIESQANSLSDVSERVGENTQNINSSSQNGDLNKSPKNFTSSKPKSQNPLRGSEEKTLTNDSTKVSESKEIENTPQDEINLSSKPSGSNNASPKKTHEFTKPYPKNRHRSSGSFSQSRTTSLSEETSSQASFTGSAPGSQGKINLEKSMKDLSRQTVALTRVHNILEEELENSFKRIKYAISEVHRLLDDRSQGLEQEMEKVKKDARALLTQRKEIAAELKQRAERSSTLTETELKELRDDIKHFVVERKYDDELGKTTRFMWNKDRIIDEIRNFGEVHHVKNCYSQRRQSVSSVASSTCLTTSALESPTEQQIPNLNSSKDNIGETSNSNDQSTDSRPHNAPTQFQGRSRVFFSSTRPHYTDYGGGNSGAGGNHSAQGQGGGSMGGNSGQTRPNYNRHYQQNRGNRGHFDNRGRGRGGFFKPHYNNPRYPNNANQQQDAEDSGNKRPPNRRGGRNPRYQNHNNGRSYQHHNNNNNNNNINATANNNPSSSETPTPKDVKVNSDKAPEGKNTSLVNGYANNH